VRSRFSEIGEDNVRFAANGSNRVSDFICAGFVLTRVHQHVGAGASQFERDRAANAARASSDDGDLAAE
jgi:hypothetical protein